MCALDAIICWRERHADMWTDVALDPTAPACGPGARRRRRRRQAATASLVRAASGTESSRSSSASMARRPR